MNNPTTYVSFTGNFFSRGNQGFRDRQNYNRGGQDRGRQRRDRDRNRDQENQN